MPQLGSNQQFTTKLLSRFTTWNPAGIFQPKKLLHFPAGFHYKCFQQSPMGHPKLIPLHSPSKIPLQPPRHMLSLFHTNRTSFHTPNLPSILLSHPGSWHLPHPDSVSHMGYNRTPLRPHGSHCSCIPGWIPLPSPVPYTSTRNSRESSCALGRG